MVVRCCCHPPFYCRFFNGKSCDYLSFHPEESLYRRDGALFCIYALIPVQVTFFDMEV